MMADQKGSGNNTSLTQTRMVHRKGGSRDQFFIPFHVSNIYDTTSMLYSNKSYSTSLHIPLVHSLTVVLISLMILNGCIVNELFFTECQQSVLTMQIVIFLESAITSESGTVAVAIVKELLVNRNYLINTSCHN